MVLIYVVLFLLIIFILFVFIKATEIGKRVFAKSQWIIRQLMNVLKEMLGLIKIWYYDNCGADKIGLVPRSFVKDKIYRQLGKALEKAYRTSEVYNIAIIGNDACGKSSFIKTYEKRHTTPGGKYLYISMRDFQNISCDELTIDKINKIFLSNLEARGFVNKMNKTFMLIVAVVVTFAFYMLWNYNERWGSLVPDQWKGKIDGVLFLMFIASLCITFIIGYYSRGELLQKIKLSNTKVTAPMLETEIELREKAAEVRCTDNLINILDRVKRRIGYTVVIEDMNLLEEDKCICIVTKLKEFNRKLNERILNHSKLGGINGPIRFLYVCSEDLYHKLRNKKIFEDFILIPDRLTVDNVSSILENMLRDLRLIKSEEPFHFDAGYISHIGKWITNYSDLHEVVKRYSAVYKSFRINLGRNKAPIEDDFKRIFSFVLYGRFFPKDIQKFNSRTSLALTLKSGEDLSIIGHEEKQKLFLYLTRECPEAYRVNYLCMRYVNFDPLLLNTHLADYENAVANADYTLALECIEKVICCDPENRTYHQMRDSILARSNISEEEALL